MGVFKPAVAGDAPITILASGVAKNSPCELVGVHYLNLTAGAGRVDIYDGTAINANLRISLGSDAANGNDAFTPSQTMKFKVNVNVIFTTGTGVVTILTN